jgi:hypothetical protein
VQEFQAVFLCQNKATKDLGDKRFAFPFRRVEDSIVNPVRQIVDDTKDKNTRGQTEMARVRPVVKAEKPEEVMEKIHQQATCLGPVMEEILRASQRRGQSHWGLNE